MAIVTTAAPFQPDKGDQGPGASYNASAKFYQLYRLPIDPEPDLRISHIAIDRVHTTAEDKATYFPLAALKQAAADGQIGAVAPFIYGFPTNRSQRTHLEQDCPALTSALLEDNVEAIILVPNCPVCHQSVALAARAAEEAGIATVIMGCAKDIVEQVGVPRFYFSDFPLGNSCGRPNDSLSQQQTLAGASPFCLLPQPRVQRSPTRSSGTGRKTGKMIIQTSTSCLQKKSPEEELNLMLQRPSLINKNGDVLFL